MQDVACNSHFELLFMNQPRYFCLLSCVVIGTEEISLVLSVMIRRLMGYSSLFYLVFLFYCVSLFRQGFDDNYYTLYSMRLSLSCCPTFTM